MLTLKYSDALILKKTAIHFKKNIYKSRHLVENLFARLKYSSRISIRFDKLARYFTTMIYIACVII
ncbi:MAG: transposase [Endozoicomonadaceae bacterium]|nr:transposase [Endozoicomonadaceae bacterium]